MINKKIISQRFTKALLSYDTEAIIQKRIVDKLLEHIKTENLYNSQSIKKILEIGCGTGLLSKKIFELFQFENIYLNDICQEIGDCFREYTKNNIDFLLGDAEKVNFPKELDLIISSSTVQWFEDFEKFIKKTAHSLKKNKYLILSTFGEKNLKEIKYITGRGLVYYSKKEIEAMISKYFNIKLIQEEIDVLFFNTPKDVLAHLKKTGVTAVDTNIFWTKDNLKTFTNSYIEKFKCEDKIILTYHPIYVIATKK